MDFTTNNASGERIFLWQSGQTPLFDPLIAQDEPSITPYLLGGDGRPAMIVCPGGGYSMKAEHEAEPIALAFNALGFNSFVLDYRVSPYRNPAPLLDAQRAIRYVRQNASSLGVDPGKIAILGFSAGGHLASTAATHFDRGDPAAADPVERVSCRPDAAVLCYAVITFFENTHGGSMANFTGMQDPPTELRRDFSAEMNVNENTPPMFLWHTAQDKSVPPQNSLNLAAALIKHDVPCALNIYPFGAHGIGLGLGGNKYNAEKIPLATNWPSDAAAFLRSIGF